MMQTQQGYDVASTVFSPDGRLFQVEYAREAVKRGTTAVGVRFKQGVVVAAEKRIASHLVEPGSVEKIFRLEQHIGCATSGLVADARALVDRVRVDAQMHRINYQEPIPVLSLVQRISDFKRSFTQHGGARPFGTALLVAGVDETGPRLFETDPSGALLEYRAGAVGAGRGKALEHFEENYKEGISEQDAVKLALAALAASTEVPAKVKGAVEVGVVTKDKPFRLMDTDQVEKIRKTVQGGAKGEKDSDES
jgi:proteasome alpha subunit